MSKIAKKKIATLASKYEVESELLIRLLQQKGVEVRSSLTMIDSDQFALIKDSLLEEVEKQKATAKPKLKKKVAVKAKSGITSNTSKKSESESGTKKSPVGLKVTLKKATLKKAEPIEIPTLKATLKKAEVTPAEVVEKTIETPVAPVTPVEAIEEPPVVVVVEQPEITEPVAETVAESAAPVVETVEVVAEVAAPVVEEIKPVVVEEPVVAEVAAPVVAEVTAPPVEKPVAVSSAVQTNSKGLKEKELKVTIEKPTDEMLARIAKYKPKPKVARKRGNGDEKGYTGKLGAAPVKKEQKPRGKDGKPNTTTVKPDSYAERLNKYADLSVATTVVPDKDAGAHGKKAKKKKGKDKKLTKAQKEERIEAVKGNVKSVMASLSKTPSKKTYKKEASEEDISEEKKTLQVSDFVTIGELAGLMEEMPAKVIGKCMEMGMMVTINYRIDFETIQLLADEFGFEAELLEEYEEEIEIEEEVDEAALEPRPPVVTVMGHVDHGKTSFLDYIRSQKVASGEAGGITQHIGAYRVQTGQGEIAFLDTPGHAAFTAMRARGAQCTDVVILVVAADDGVMPQTEEAILHSRAAGVPIVVAINKCDKESADPERVKNELSAKGVIPESWGGDAQFIEVSAHTGEGVDALLEAISLQAELLELKAVIDAPARGVVVESRVDKGRGVVATLLIQQGTFKQGDLVLAGQSYGRARAMTNEHGEQVREVGPSSPVEILGLDSTPSAGDDFIVLTDERKAREMAEFRAEKERSDRLQRQQVAKLENMFADMEGGQKKILSVVLKTDVKGSLEAIQTSLADIGNDEVEVQVVSSGVGGITENDVNLALTSGAIVIGFNVRAAASTRRIAETEGVEIRYYSIIYQLLDEVKSALSGMLDPERVETIVGIADVREVFSSPKFGQVAGCMVVEGTVYRNKPIRVLRENVVIYEGELESLRRFKDDVQDVRNGVECGIGVRNYDVKVGDQIEVFEVSEVARTL